MPARSRSLLALVVIALLVLAACGDGGSDGSSPDGTGGSPGAPESADDRPTATTRPGPPACELLGDDVVTFVLGEPFAATSEAATSSTCVFRRTGVSGDQLTLTISTAADPDTQLASLEGSEAFGGDAFRRVELGDGAFVTVADGRPRGGVFLGGELYEVVLVLSDPLGVDASLDQRVEALLVNLAA